MSGMSAMEKMVANMLGLTPEAMHNMISGYSTLATELKAQLDRVELGIETIITNQDALAGRLEAIENERGNGNDNRSSGNTGRRTGNGNAGQRNGTAGDGAAGSGAE